MKQRTLRDVKKDIAAAFPDMTFTWTTEGRGASRGPCCSWFGGPSKEAVRASTVIPRGSWRTPPKTYHFIRTMTPEEQAVYDAEQEAAHQAWLAAAPEREARRKAETAANRRAGAAQAAETRRVKAALAARLLELYPATVFAIGSPTPYGAPPLQWTDGPGEDTVRAALGRSAGYLTREVSAAAKAQEIAFKRLQRRLARAKARPAIVAKALTRLPRNALGPRRRYVAENQLQLL